MIPSVKSFPPNEQKTLKMRLAMSRRFNHFQEEAIFSKDASASACQYSMYLGINIFQTSNARTTGIKKIILIDFALRLLVKMIRRAFVYD